MIGRLVAIGAAAVAAVAGAGAAVWARRRSEEDPVSDKAAAPESISEAAPPQDRATPATVASPPAESGPDGRAMGGGALTSLKGIGSVSAERLAGIGVTSLAQVAAWTDGDIESIAASIKVSPERIRREDWIGQAGAKLEG